MKRKDAFFNNDLANALKPLNDPFLKMDSFQSTIEQANSAKKLAESIGDQAWIRDIDRYSDIAKQMQPFVEQNALAHASIHQTVDLFKQSAFDQIIAQQNFLKSITPDGMARTLDFVRDIGFLAEGTLATFRSLQDTVLDNQLFTIERNFSGLIDIYSDLYSITDSAIKLPEIPSDLIGFPPIEVFNASRLVHSLNIGNVEEDEDNESSQIISFDHQKPKDNLPMLLAQVNPDFISLWEGAKQSLVSDNPDRSRHTITSLRELISQLLHHLAPTADVEKWTQDPKHYHNKRPTRRARLDYICRSINVPPFCAFLNKDLQALLEFIDLYQKGTHELMSSLGTDALNVILIRTDNAIRFLIQISSLNNKN